MKLWFVVVMLLLVACTQDKMQPKQAAHSDVETSSNLALSGTGSAAAKSMTSADIYTSYSDQIYYVKTECLYDYLYPGFFIRSSVHPQWGVIIDLAMRKNNTIAGETDGSVKNTLTWYMETRRNSTKQYGTAFLSDGKLYTNNHVVECPDTNTEIVNSFDVIDMSGQDVNAIGDEVYANQENFAELRTSKDLIGGVINRSVDEHFRSKAKFTLVERKVLLYHGSSEYKRSIQATVLANGTSFPGIDYAILSIGAKGEGVELQPNDVRAGDSIYLLGFPWVTSFDRPEDHDEMETNPPIITKGIISNRVLSDKNVPYYVVDAAATFGSSGSPVFNEQGEVVGIVTSGVWGSDINLVLPIGLVPEQTS
jgi:hypothetical protein